ncbi:MAG: HAD family hydrolase [Thermoplasmata archaeon]
MTPDASPAGTWRLVTVDIDGTLTTVHGWKVIADALGRGEQYAWTQRRFAAGAIGEDEHLQNMLAVTEGRTVAEIEAALSATPRLAGIVEGVRAFHERGCRVALLTHNPPFVCEWYRRTFGFDDFEGTSGPSVADGIVQPLQVVRADKPSGLRALLLRHGVSADRVVHVGDGRADVAIFRLVGRGVALNSGLPDVERAADLALRATDFRAVVRAVSALGPRP